jgi:PAS domain S-box-containing protein
VTHISGLDRNASTIYISPQVEQVLGYGPSAWLADPDLWVELLHEDDRDAAIAGNEEFLRTGEPFRMEYRMRARDGRVVWIRDVSVMIRDADGQPVEMQGIMLDVTDTRRAKEELQRSLTLLERSDAERRDLLAHLVHAQEQERVRIASDIHDDPLQKLTAVGMRLAGLRRELGESRSDALLQLERTISGAISSLRSLLFEVRPPSLDREGLAIALSQYLRETCGPSELGWELDDQLVVEPPSEVRAICYRIAQEALTNVRKHAHASTVRVELSSSDEGVRVRVLDDGIGIDLDAPGSGVGHLGIPSMRERAELAGGGLRIATPPDGGTAVEFWIPSLPPDAGTDSS